MTQNWIEPNYQCKNCKTTLPLPQYLGKYCYNCGKQQPTVEELQVTRCIDCKAELKEGAKFCIECGKEVGMVKITDYLPYPHEENFQISDELIAPSGLIPSLKRLKAQEVKILYDGSKSQGLELYSGGTCIGKVTVFFNINWQQELYKLIEDTAKEL